MVYYYNAFLTLMIFFSATIIYFLHKSILDKAESFSLQSSEIPEVKWPFLNLQNENNQRINVLVIRGYLDSDKKKQDFLDYVEKGYAFIGCSSNQSFPRYCDNPHGFYCNEKNKNNQTINGKYIEEYVLGWCHCFKEPAKYIRGNIPLLLCSESDFNSETNLKPDKSIEKKYDYICVQPKNNSKCTLGWHAYYKNWPLCEKAIQVLSDQMGLKGLVVGWEDCPINIKKKKM